MDISVPQFILDAIREAAEKCGFHSEDVEIRIDPCNSQDGFIGQLFKATLKHRGSPDKSLICKIPPLCAARREQFDTSLMFEREPWFYERILPEFERYQRGKGVDEEDGFVAYAESYVAYYKSMDQGTVLVMEDLGRRGFRMYNKQVPLDYDHMKLAMVQLGRFHAVSFAMKRDQPKLYDSLKVPNAIVELFRRNGYCQFLVRESLKLVLDIPGLTEVERKVLNQLKDNVLAEFEACLDLSRAEPYTAIIHNDCWINNCMFSYEGVESLDEENARVVVRFSIGGGQESLNEYLLQLVSNAEYKKYSKVLNNAKYEEFKNRTTETKSTIKEEKHSTDYKLIKRDPSASPSPPRPTSSAKSQSSRSYRDDNDQPQRSTVTRRERSPDTRADDRRQYRQDRQDRNDQSRRDRRSPAREDRRRGDERQRRRQTSSSSSDDASDSDESNDRDRDRHHHHHRHKSASTSSYARTSSGTKKKSHKYKQRRDHSRERDRDRGHSSDEDDRHHKKKTKKSKKQRSRSRSRR